MDEFTSGVEMEMQENAQVADVAALAEVTEQTDVVESVEAEMEQPQQQEAKQKDGGTEPGWIKSRITAAVKKAEREWEARMQERIAAEMAPFLEMKYEREAEALVAEGEFKTKERALEYVKLKNGSASKQASTPQQEAPRDANGRFASREEAPVNDAKATAEKLKQQADALKAEHGFDAMALFRSNEAIKQKVVTGKLDFNDLYELYGNAEQSKPNVPAPMRSSNGSFGNAASIVRTMTDQGFAKLDAELASGKKYRTT